MLSGEEPVPSASPSEIEHRSLARIHSQKPLGLTCFHSFMNLGLSRFIVQWDYNRLLRELLRGLNKKKQCIRQSCLNWGEGQAGGSNSPEEDPSVDQ